MMFPTEHRYDMYGPKDKLGDGGSYHNVPSGLHGSDSTQKQYHQVTYDQSYYNNHYHMNNHQTADIHHVHQQNTVFDQGNSQQGRCGKFHTIAHLTCLDSICHNICSLIEWYSL
jgi:hypothetical protein